MSREPTDLTHLGVMQLHKGYLNGLFRPTDVLSATEARIARLQPILNVFVHLDLHNARRAAKEADIRFETGKSLGPMDGIPVGIKDIIDVSGMPTTCGSRVLGRQVVEKDAALVARLRQVGAVILGKVATHEFANGLPSLDLLDPPARNPWNPEYHPGGSSSGSGAGVAAEMFPLGIGTDTGGSARHPGSACGVVGLKPTYGAISKQGVFPLSFSMDTIGLLTRSVEDAALALKALAISDDINPSSNPTPWDNLDSGADVKGMRIGYVRHFHMEDMIADPEVTSGLDRAADLFKAGGAIVDECRLAPAAEYFAVNRAILHADAFTIHKDWLLEQPENYGAAQRESLMVGAFLSASDLVRAQMRRTELINQMRMRFNEYDILLCASSMDTAGRFDEPEITARNYARQTRTPFSVTGNPAISLMSGLAANGLPTAIQLAAGAWDEPRLLQAARYYEEARGPMPKAPTSLA